MMNEATTRILFWVLGVCLIVAALTCKAEAQQACMNYQTGQMMVCDGSQYNQPHEGLTYCVNHYVAANQKRKIIEAAKAFPELTYTEDHYACDLAFVRSDTDTLLPKRSFVLALFQGMSKRKAKELFRAFLVLRNISSEVYVNGSKL